MNDLAKQLFENWRDSTFDYPINRNEFDTMSKNELKSLEIEFKNLVAQHHEKHNTYFDDMETEALETFWAMYDELNVS